MDLSSGAVMGVGVGPVPPPGCAEAVVTKELNNSAKVRNADLEYIMVILIGNTSRCDGANELLSRQNSKNLSISKS